MRRPVMRFAFLVLWVGCVQPASGGYYAAAPQQPMPAAEPAAASQPHLLTKQEIDAIPNAFPVTLVPPTTRAYVPMYESFKKVNPMEIGSLVSVLLILEDRVHVPISVEECGKASAQYSPRTKSIRVCYEFVEYANELAGRKGADLAIVDTETNSLLIFATLHEIGHALVDSLDLPIAGNEEDRGDELAFLFMTNIKDGELARSLLAAPTSFFARHGEAVGTRRDGIHSAGGERAFDAVCLLYGRQGDLKAKKILGAKAQGCIDWAVTIRDLWRKWLRPYSRVTNGHTF